MNDEYNVSVNAKFKLSRETVSGIMESADYGGISYWAEHTEWQEESTGYDVYPQAENLDTDEPTHKRILITELAQTLCLLGFSSHEPFTNIRSDIRDNARRAVQEDDGGFIDAEVADVVVQLAYYRELVFG